MFNRYSPDSPTLKGISVGGGGSRVWALDKTGAAYVRHGISEEVPTGEEFQWNARYFGVGAIMKLDSGQCWLQVAPPGNAAAPDSRIRSISLGGPAGNLVWAVDAGNRLHIRKEVSVVYPEGTSWIQVGN